MYLYLFIKLKYLILSSRQHIADRLINVLGWKPKSFTQTGQPEVNEKILSQLPYPEAKLISEYLMIQKRLGQLSDGEQAYLKLNKRGKIYGKVITNGAVTGRCTHHSHQTLAQCVSSVLVSMVKNFVPYLLLLPIWLCVVLTFLGWSFVCWVITCIIMTMEIFQKHYWKMIYIPPIKKLQDLPTRSKAKTFIYAFIYGCGDKKLSEILDVTLMKKPKE